MAKKKEVDSMIKAENLEKTYRSGKRVIVKALDDVSFEVNEKEVLALVGPSGSGKSTILSILGGLDTDYKGKVIVAGKEIRKYDSNYYRRNVVATIFQQFYLVPSLSVEENIMLPIKFGDQLSKEAAKERLEYLLKKVGLDDRRKHRPNELSGGQAQRVAIARALMPKPQVLLADEPTGNLDSKTGEDILKLLLELNKEEGTTMIIITHDSEIAAHADRKVFLRDGKNV